MKTYKSFIVVFGTLLAGTAVGYCQNVQKNIDWDYMGVRPTRDINEGEELKVQDLEQIPLEPKTALEIRKDNVKSIMSAIDRNAKRAITKSQLLMYSDLSKQAPAVDRPKPEFEPERGCVAVHRYGPQP